MAIKMNIKRIWFKALPYIKNKYILTFFIFLIWMLFFDNNNLIDRYHALRNLNQLQKDKKYYIQKIEKLIRQTITAKDIPADVFVESTPYEEKQEQAKEIDMQKRRENPEFKGAFHEKKTLNQHKKFDAAKAKKNPHAKPVNRKVPRSSSRKKH